MSSGSRFTLLICHGMWASPHELEHFSIRNGDLLVCEGGEGGRSAVVQGIAGRHIIQNALHRVRPRGRSSNLWLQYVMSVAASAGLLEAINSKATIAHFTADKFNALMIPMPRPDEVSVLVAYLDRETAKIDALIARNEVLIERLKEQRAALITRTVTRGLPPNESRKAGIDPHPKLKPSGVEWLGDVPEHWEIAALCRVTTDIRASNVDKHVRSNEVAVKLCNYVDVYYNERIDSTTIYMHGSATGKQIDIFQLREGDVLITKDSEVQDNIGVPALVVEHVPKLVAGYHLVLVRPDLRCLYGPYLFRALQSEIASLQFTHCAQGVTRYGMTYPGIRSVRLPIPPLVEQRAIASYLNRETAKIDKARSLARKENVLLREHRARMISDMVTGQVNVENFGRAALQQ